MVNPFKHLSPYYQVHRKDICFLDTKVKVDKMSKLYIDLYVKPTDTNSYLNYMSAHPPTCKNSLPYSQLLRIKKICTKSKDFEKHASTKIKEIESKDYQMEILENALSKVKEHKRDDLIKKKEKTNDKNTEDNTFLTCTFRPHYQKVPKLVKKY